MSCNGAELEITWLGIELLNFTAMLVTLDIHICIHGQNNNNCVGYCIHLFIFDSKIKANIASNIILLWSITRPVTAK